MTKSHYVLFSFLVFACLALVFYYLVRPSDAILQPMVIGFDDREMIRQGQRLYADQCAICHGVNLEGEAGWRQARADGSLPAPPHDETGHSWHHPDMILFAITKYGGQIFAGNDFASNMPAFETEMTDDEIAAVLAYIKSHWPEDIQKRQLLGTKRANQEIENK